MVSSMTSYCRQYSTFSAIWRFIFENDFDVKIALVIGDFVLRCSIWSVNSNIMMFVFMRFHVYDRHNIRLLWFVIVILSGFEITLENWSERLRYHDVECHKTFFVYINSSAWRWTSNSPGESGKTTEYI